MLEAEAKRICTEIKRRFDLEAVPQQLGEFRWHVSVKNPEPGGISRTIKNMGEFIVCLYDQAGSLHKWSKVA